MANVSEAVLSSKLGKSFIYHIFKWTILTRGVLRRVWTPSEKIWTAARARLKIFWRGSRPSWVRPCYLRTIHKNFLKIFCERKQIQTLKETRKQNLSKHRNIKSHLQWSTVAKKHISPQVSIPHSVFKKKKKFSNE